MLSIILQQLGLPSPIHAGEVPIEHYIYLSIILFSIGVLGTFPHINTHFTLA
ncbi:MAG: hypothetical protein IPN94_08025 [Sphingobacteriales bacterium]|nr:hypothetical protein [Sphingobacteriales bacterium]